MFFLKRAARSSAPSRWRGPASGVSSFGRCPTSPSMWPTWPVPSGHVPSLSGRSECLQPKCMAIDREGREATEEKEVVEVGNWRPNHSGRIAGVAALWLAVVGGCWLLAFGGGYGADIPSWVVAVPVFAGFSVTGFLWFVSKFAHGGDWVHDTDASRQPRPELPDVDNVY